MNITDGIGKGCWDADANYQCNWQKEPQPQTGPMPHCAKWQKKLGRKKPALSRGRKNHLDFILHIQFLFNLRVIRFLFQPWWNTTTPKCLAWSSMDVGGVEICCQTWRCIRLKPRTKVLGWSKDVGTSFTLALTVFSQMFGQDDRPNASL